MDRKPVGGIVNRQRDSSSFLSNFFSWNEGFLRRREILDRTFIYLFFLLQTVNIHQSKFQSFKQQKQYLKRKGECWPSVQKNRDHTDGGYGGLMLAKAWLSFQIFLSPPSMTVNLSLLFSFSVLPFCNVCLSKPYFWFLCFFLIASFSISLRVLGFFVSPGFF